MQKQSFSFILEKRSTKNIEVKIQPKIDVKVKVPDPTIVNYDEGGFIFEKKKYNERA
jgi:hypothetical protein